MTPDLSPLMVPGVLEAHLDGADVVLSVATEAQALQVLPVLVGYTLKGCRVVDGVLITQAGSCRDIKPLKVVEVRLTGHLAQRSA